METRLSRHQSSLNVRTRNVSLSYRINADTSYKPSLSSSSIYLFKSTSLPVFTEMTRCHGYIHVVVAKAMAVEVDTDKYYFERIFTPYYRSGFVVLSKLSVCLCLLHIIDNQGLDSV